MKYSDCKFYFLNFLFLLLSSYAWSDSLSLPKASSCSLRFSPDQQAFVIKQCQKAAQAGDSNAQYLLGLYYSEGTLTPPDYNQAIYWLKEASSQASVEAQVRLGDMYKSGIGVPVDSLQAYVIYKIASINGSDVAMDQADAVAENLSQQELQQANYILGMAFKEYLSKIN